jgi:omega-amidase
MKKRVIACQQPLDQPLSDSAIEEILKHHTDFVCLPEHYPLDLDVKNILQAAERYDQRKKYLASLSLKLKAIVIGGTLTEKTTHGFYNTCYVFEDGKEIGFYRKIHPTAREQAVGVLSGDEFKVFDIHGLSIGVLICADVLNPDSFKQLASLGSRLVFIPTASPLRQGESLEEKYERDRSIFLEGARILKCPLVKTCGVGTTFGHPLQGRSLIATPDEIVARAEPDQEDAGLLLFAELDV